MSPVENPVLPNKVPQTLKEDVIFPPSEIDSNEPPLESEIHLRQILLFLSCLEWLWKDRTDYYATGNLTIYYSPHQKKSEYFRGPDFFVVLNTQKKYRRSWVVWEEEGKYPNVIIEVLSKGTASTDKTTKKEIYQDSFRTPDYFLFDPDKLELVGFHLVDGKYEEIEANPQGRLWSQQLGLYLGIEGNFVRFFTPEGELVPTPEEDARQAQQQIQLERQQTQQAQQQKERLADKLRELGIDPDTI
ncbi:Uma2 family endonuclease [Lusitaniella coriacea LEGE 07157]|uniref:Uma2 family endonuclease n=1 Tax=Lusitaniella coriacea LEGE 07157 TaxID=945747 RepID=A0A8J7DXG5_9CYAN|nr:Uma2 family endonuclease [Lusitaniella coriacea]MBE9116795.1 Uma2 family endonuclease [Lusitaniella coriacea LEGE 07157]